MNTARSRWQPILHGRLADEAWVAVRAIAHDVARATTLTQPRDLRLGDLLLFWTYVAGALDDELSNQAHEQTMARFAETIDDSVLASPGLYGGLWHPWVLGHVSEPGDHEPFFSAIDERLAQLLAVPRWDGYYEFLYGLAGYGVYELDRLAQLQTLEATGGVNTSSARALVRHNLHAIVTHLESLARPEHDGLTWFTPPAHVPAYQQQQAQEGMYNLGLAHGVPGVVGMLGRLASTEACSPAADRLLQGGSRWLWAKRNEAGAVSSFPSQILPGGLGITRRRTAWCYGDPGVITCLWMAAKHTRSRTDEIEALALTCAERAPEACSIRDSALCHGSMGLAHLYNRYYHASGNPRFAQAATRWFEHGLAQRDVVRPGAAPPAVGGFVQWKEDDQGEGAWGGRASFLAGSGGIALALLGGLGHEEPLWDRALLTDLPLA